tara:strand:- start:1145 stop:2722 length:1578 start_codon:yes stop_codon:yes gene_type:complete
MKIKLLALSAFFLILVTGCSQNIIENEINTNHFTITGFYDSETGIYSYKGIPFAEAPTGENRWRPPVPLTASVATLDGSEYGPICMQGEPTPFSMWTQEFIAPAGNMSEDCLNLNIWTQEGSVDDKRPVLVFIHGGGFSSGSNSVPVYDGTRMAQKGVVFVSINYRLGVFGFFSHPELGQESEHSVSGNYGLMDQIAALQWIQENIHHFGGDPENVTIAGQSAGAFSVHYLVSTPKTKGLFHKAIAESGAAIFPRNNISGTTDLDWSEEQGLTVQNQLGADSLEELRLLDAEQLLNVQARFSPIIDGYLFPAPIYQLYTDGVYNDVPVLMGWNANEGNFSGAIQSADEFKNTIEAQYGEYSNQILTHFPAGNDEIAAESQVELGSLSIFGLQLWKWANMQIENDGSDIFMYHFTKEVPYNENQRPYGAFHTGEVPYAYHTLDMSDRPWTDSDRYLSDVMSDYWVNFAKNGDPNETGLPQWEPFTTDAYQTIILGEEIRMATIPSLERLKILDKYHTDKLKGILSN